MDAAGVEAEAQERRIGIAIAIGAIAVAITAIDHRRGAVIAAGPAPAAAVFRMERTGDDGRMAAMIVEIAGVA